MHSGKQLSAVGQREVLSFGTRSGTRQGVEAHVFRTESQRDLSAWSRNLVQGVNTAALLVKEVSCRKYIVHYHSGYHGYRFIVNLACTELLAVRGTVL